MTFEDLYVMLKALRDEKEAQRNFWGVQPNYLHEFSECLGYVECADVILGLISAEASCARESRLGCCLSVRPDPADEA